jgi:hypothetical protein
VWIYGKYKEEGSTVSLPKPMAIDDGTLTTSLSMIVEYEVCRRVSLCSWIPLVFSVYYQR